MAPSSRAFRPTRRDLLVAVFSAAVSLLWFQTGQTDHFSSIRQNDPWPLQAPLDAKPDLGLEHHDAPRVLLEHPAAPTVPPSKLKPPELMPSTTMVAHGDGWTLFENIYMFNGSLLVVSDDEESSFPEKRMMTSTGENLASPIFCQLNCT